MASKEETLLSIINDPFTEDSDRSLAQQSLDELNRLASVGSAKMQEAAKAGTDDAAVNAILDALSAAMKSGGGGGNVNMQDVRKAVNEELAKRKITKSDLSPDLIAFIDSKRKVSLTVSKLFGKTVTKQVDADVINRPLMQLLLSDVFAKNNSYLYGGAGTGKTYIAEQVADLLDWTPITLNCNQFTSPLDILGGQTITGYQEGKLSMAWSNIIEYPDGRKEKVAGVVLILDELPKIDPNTAGILNDALAKIKDYKYNDATKEFDIPPKIRNGKNEVLSLGNLYVIATGNVPLNTIDPDYEANFKQDLSLQDRFIGSTYRVFVDYANEFYDIMKGFAFIWIFLVKVRQAIEKPSIKATGQAFVSLRLMKNVKATYEAYRDAKGNFSQKAGDLSNNALSNPKSIIQSMETFFGLFKPATKEAILRDVDFDGFKRIVAEKDKMPYDPNNPNFDTASELATGEQMVKDYQALQKNI